MPRSDTKQVGARLLGHTSTWPSRWCFDDDGLTLGNEIVASVTPFLEHLVRCGLAETTIRRHFSNIWLLGGEIVREGHMDEAVRKLTGPRLLERFIDEEGGPLLYGCATEQEQTSFDTTCRKLHLFISGGSTASRARRPPN